MISCDANILFPACDRSSHQHEAATAFLESYRQFRGFCLAEQALMELYCLVRNPVVSRKPLSARQAVNLVQTFRSNPLWRIVDVVQDRTFMAEVWDKAAEAQLAYRRIFDLRLAATLRRHGVREFATCNVKDFEGLGFDRVWNPLT